MSVKPSFIQVGPHIININGILCIHNNPNEVGLNITYQGGCGQYLNCNTTFMKDQVFKLLKAELQPKELS
jgi:hypothetical protein